MAIILKRGLEANRAAASAREGEILYSKDTGRIYIGSGSGNLGGNEIKFYQLTASFVDALHISSSGVFIKNNDTSSRVSLLSTGEVASANGIFVSRVSAGTNSSPSSTLTGHHTSWQMQSFGGSTWSTVARMQMQAATDHNENSRPTNIIFSTVPSGSSTLVDRFKINGTGVQVTGSLGVSGSVNLLGTISASAVSASGIFAGALTVTSVINGTSSWSSNSVSASSAIASNTAISASYAVSASYAISTDWSGVNNKPAGIVSSSAQTVANLVGQNISVATVTSSGGIIVGGTLSVNGTGPHTFNGPLSVSTTATTTAADFKNTAGSTLVRVGRSDTANGSIFGWENSSGTTIIDTVGAAWPIKLRNNGTEAASFTVAASSISGNLTAAGTGSHVFGTTNTVTITTGSLTATGNATINGGTLIVQSATSNPTVHIKSSADTYNPSVRFEGFNRNIWIGLRDTGADGTLVFSTAATLEATQLMTISPIGTVGIFGNMIVSGSGTNTFFGAVSVGSSAAQVKFDLDRTSVTDAAYVRWKTSGSQNWVIGTGATGNDTNLTFYSYNGGASALSLNSTTGNATFGNMVTAVGITSSLFGTASWATNVITAQTASFISLATHNNSVVGTGIISSSAQSLVSLQGSNINSSSAQTLVSIQGSSIASSSAQVVSLISGQQISPGGITSSLLGTSSTASFISLATHNNSIVGTGIVSSSAQTLISLQGSNINSSSAQTLVSLQGSSVASSSAQIVTLIASQQISPSGVTSSLFGTSSWANNSVTSLTASYISLATHNNSVVGTGIISSSAQTLVGLQGSNIVSSSAQTLVNLQSSGIYSSSAQTVSSLSGQNISVSTITASNIQVTNLNVTNISSSIIYSSGSNIFGNNVSNTQTFTGSVLMQGQLTAGGITSSLLGTASFASRALTASFAENFNPLATASYAINALSSSLAQTASFVSQATTLRSIIGTGIVSGSAQTLVNLQGSNINSSSAQTLVSLQGSSVVSSSAQVVTLVSNQQISPSGVTSSLFGTASWATNAITSATASFISLATFKNATVSSGIISSSAQTLVALQSSNINSSSAQTLVSLQGSSVVSSSTQVVSFISGQQISPSGITSSLLGTASFATIASTSLNVAGATNYVARFNGANSVRTGSIYDDGTNVGINITSPTQALTVKGNVKLAGAQNSNVANLIFTRTDASWRINNETDLRFYYGAGDTDTPTTFSITLRNNGNVGIGAITPSYKLEVSSSANAEFVRFSDNTNRSIGFGSYTPNSGGETIFINGTGVASFHASQGMLIGSGFVANLGRTNGLSVQGWTGIGVLLPNANLHVSGSISSSLLQIDSPSSPYALFVSGSGNVGIGTSTPAYKLEVSGSFAATNKSFVIDHPTKKGKKLQHGVVEGPEHSVFVRGKNSSLKIVLPEYWVNLVHEETITVQLTPIGRVQNLYVVSVNLNEIVIGTDGTPSDTSYYYYVQAERKDIPKMEVEY